MEKLMIFSFEDLLVSRLCNSIAIAQISNKSYLIGTHKLLLPLCSGFQRYWTELAYLRCQQCLPNS